MPSLYKLCNKEGSSPQKESTSPEHPAWFSNADCGNGHHGPLPTRNSYILVIADYFTRWIEAYAIPNQEAQAVALKLTDKWFCRFSVPEQLHSDQAKGRQFESDVIASICKLLRILKTRTTPYHLQSDGLVKRANRTLLSMLAICTKEHPSDWETHLRKVCLAYNTSMTGYTPFYLMFGRQAWLPVDVMYHISMHLTRQGSYIPLYCITSPCIWFPISSYHALEFWSDFWTIANPFGLMFHSSSPLTVNHLLSKTLTPTNLHLLLLLCYNHNFHKVNCYDGHGNISCTD